MMLEIALPKIVLSLFVIFHGIALGAGWYEHKISLPQWLVTNQEGTSYWNAKAAREADVGKRFWGLVTTVPLTLLTLLSLILVWQTQHNTQIFWIAASP
jgi:hypothetical protein